MKNMLFPFLLLSALLSQGQTKPDTLIPLPPMHTITPSTERNYTIHYRPHAPVTSISRRLGLSETEATINYFDGLGRCIQTVETGATPERLDLIKPVIPDFCDRQGVKDYIPYQGSTSKGVYTKNAQEAQNNYYAGIYGPDGGDACAYAEKRYEQSGAERLTESSRPGNTYRLSAGHTLRYTYALNTANEVRLYTYNNSSLNSTGYYRAGHLYKQETKDEDNRRRMTFTDHRGNTVLERLCLSSGNTLDTYYIYDTFSRPLCIIPPALGGKASITAYEIAAYCYRYAYDKRGNVTERSLPGMAPEKITYNAAGLPVARDQDERHFTTNYDSHNRMLNEYYRYENGSSITVLQRTYDTYPSGTGLAFAAITGYDPSCDTRTTGLLTYEKERILAGSSKTETGIPPRFIERCFYYDKKGRIIQQVEKNHLGGISRYSYAYDFVGNITAEREEHAVGNGTTTIEKRNTYDHVSRLLSSKIFLNGTYRGKVGYKYDALGQLTGRYYGEDILAEQISYDIQGRTTSQGSALFRIGLRYENPLKATPRYAGDIAEWTCNYQAKPEQTYTFNYDGAGRFTGGNHYENGTLVNKYVEQGIAYDKNGNILALKRYNNGALVDNLTYSYNGNRLSSLTEAETPATGDIYPRQNAATATYNYDVYGNLIKDNRKNLNFEYNILNLVHSVKQGTNLQAEYEYAYTGSKLRVTASDGKGYAYLGSLVYMCTGSSYIFEYGIFGEGTVNSSGICYHLKDHLGSIRAVIDGNGKLLEANDYYAFGQRQPRSELPQLAANRFKYNGKELQTVGNLAFLDYGARMYDPPLGRWFDVDPLCEKYYSLSPYVYCGNSPIRHIDPDGRDWYSNEHGNMMWRRSGEKTHTDDNGVVWTNAGTTYLHRAKDGSGIYFSQSTNAQGEMTLSSHRLSKNEMAVFGLYHSEKAMMAAIEYHVKPTMGNLLATLGKELAAQWTTPELLVSGLSIGMAGWQGMTKIRSRMNMSLWPAASGRETVINGIEYTTHALERMQPVGTIIKGTGLFSRGVPPSIVENVIKYGKITPGNTSAEVVRTFKNVRVITNPQGTRVISVIKIGN